MPGVTGESPSRRAKRQGWATIFPDEDREGFPSEDRIAFPALPFASCFAYLPGGRGGLCEEGKLLCAKLKAADPVWLPQLVAQVWMEAKGHRRFPLIFGGPVILVPVPGSAPVRATDCLGARLASCLTQIGLAAEVWPVLRRRHAVRKSAFAAAGERPSALEHYASFAIERGAWCGAPVGAESVVRERSGSRLRLTLVDDVITRGRTLMAAAVRIREAFPEAEVRAFAFLRTLNADEILRRVLDPCEGEIRWRSGDARRRP